MKRLIKHQYTNWKGDIMKFFVVFITAFFFGVWLAQNAHADEKPKVVEQIETIFDTKPTIDKVVIQIEELTASSIEDIVTKIKVAKENSYIILVFNTFGGQVFATFDLLKAIELSSTPIICIVDARVMSAGVFLLQSCDVRLSTDRSVFMTHAPFVSSNAQMILTTERLKEINESLIVLGNAMAVQITSKSIMTKDEYLRKIMNGDWNFTPTEAMTHGFIDGMMTIEEYKQFIR